MVEHACGMATLQMGEYVSDVSSGIDTYNIREPLGVCAGICPFNFPAMIPLWVSCFLLFWWLFCYAIVFLLQVLGYSFISCLLGFLVHISMQRCMIFLQMFPVAVTCGNTFILKPSEKVPGDTFYLIWLFMNLLALTPQFGWSFALYIMEKGAL